DSSDYSYSLAADSLAKVGLGQVSERTLTDGLKDHPGQISLTLALARLRLSAGDVAGARLALKLPSGNETSLADRPALEEVRAQREERDGHAEEAVLARARARLIARERQRTGDSLDPKPVK